MIYFIHHVAASIQASSILTAITAETRAAIKSLFPEPLGAPGKTLEDETLPDRAEWYPLASEATGYLQHIHVEGVTDFARKHSVILKIEQRSGDFVSPGTSLVSTDRPLEEDAAAELRTNFSTGEFRTVDQDPGFGIRQIVDIAMKALSPGVNDTSTAVSCLDYLGALLCQLAGCRLVSLFPATDGVQRVIAPASSFEHFLAKSVDEIRHSASGNVTILRHIIQLLARVAGATSDPSHRAALLLHAQLASELASHSIRTPYDRVRISEEIALTRDALHASMTALPPLSEKQAVCT